MKRFIIFITVLLMPLSAGASVIKDEYLNLGINDEFQVSSDVFPDFDPAKTVEDLSLGKGFDTKNIINSLVSFFFREFISMVKICIMLLGVGFLSGILNTLGSSFSSKGTVSAGKIAVYAVYASLAAASFIKITQSANQSIETLCLMIKTSLPVLVSMTALTGGTATAGLMNPVLLSLITAIEEVLSKAVFPLILSSVALSIANNMSDRINLKISVGLLRKTAKWIMVFCMGIYSGFFGIYGIAGSGIDKTVGKAAKFAIGTSVPVVGGVVAESVETVLTTLSAVKNITGVISIIVIVITLITPAIKTAAAMWCFKLFSALLEPVADKSAVRLTFDISEAISLVFAVLMCVMLLFSGSIGILLISGNIL